MLDVFMTTEELKKRKKRLRITTEYLANLAGLPVSTVSKVMTGETKKPSYITIEKIDAALCKEEAKYRIATYLKCMLRYFETHPDEHRDEMTESEFERRYREKYDLDDKPIEYARPRKDPYNEDYLVELNLALGKHKWNDVTALSTYGEDRTAELIDGLVVKSEMPGMMHQNIVDEIGFEIKLFIKNNSGKCKAYTSGVNVYLDEDEHTLVIPDITVVCRDDIITDRGIWGAPDWVIEVTSPSTKVNDYGIKMQKYMKAGVREYWLIDTDAERIIVYVNNGQIITTIYTYSDRIPVNIYEGRLEICISELLR